jgi:hypothetical protein
MKQFGIRKLAAESRTDGGKWEWREEKKKDKKNPFVLYVFNNSLGSCVM